MTRRGYVLSNIFALWLGIAAVAGALSFWLIPGARDISLTDKAGSMVEVWTVMYLAAGIFTIGGILKVSPRMEMAGMFLFAPALIMNSVAVIFAHGTVGLISALITGGLAAACCVRIKVLYDAYRIAHEEISDDPGR